MPENITVEEARTYFNYDPATGVLTWKSPTTRTVKPGDIAGNVSKNAKDRYVYVHDEPIVARRLIWLIAYGEMPNGRVCVRNGDSSDMSLNNLFLKPIKTPSEEMRDRNYQNRLRHLWMRTNRDIGETGWPSFSDFAKTIGDKAFAQCTVVPVCTEDKVGPENFKIETRAKHNRKTREGRIAYYTHKNAQNKDKRRASELKIKFGMTVDQFQEMVRSQKGLCAVCNKPETAVHNGIARQLSIDHCHASGGIRDLLCSNCNRGIGYLQDDPHVLRSAVAYIERHAEKIKKQQSSAPASNIVHLKTKQER